jgi:hypothetical protein
MIMKRGHNLVMSRYLSEPYLYNYRAYCTLKCSPPRELLDDITFVYNDYSSHG